MNYNSTVATKHVWDPVTKTYNKVPVMPPGGTPPAPWTTPGQVQGDRRFLGRAPRGGFAFQSAKPQPTWGRPAPAPRPAAPAGSLPQNRDALIRWLMGLLGQPTGAPGQPPVPTA